MFPHHILIHDAFHANLRAEQRDISMNHAVLAAREGIEHMGAGGVLYHDAVVPENPATSIRVVTDAARKKAITAYYLPTADAVQEREEKQGRVAALTERDRAARAASQESSHKKRTSKDVQHAKQMIRGHGAGEHDGHEHSDCPLCP